MNIIKQLNRLGEYKDKRVVLLQSGGLDSNIIASVFKYYGFEMHHIFVDYGQNMVKKEREYATKIAKHYGGTFSEVKIQLPWLSDTTNLVDHNVRDIKESGVVTTFEANKELTYVPLRNQILVSIVGSYAEAYKIKYIACAFDGLQDSNKKPLGGTTDKHLEFVHRLNESLNEGSAMRHIYHNDMKILTPIMNLYKNEIIELGLLYNADMSISWSCYNNSEKPCGRCSACDIRAAAFRYVGIDDPALK